MVLHRMGLPSPAPLRRGLRESFFHRRLSPAPAARSVSRPAAAFTGKPTHYATVPASSGPRRPTPRSRTPESATLIDRYSRRILNHLADTRYEPRTTRELARDLSVPDEDFNEFRRAVEQLVEADQLVLGAADTVALPPPGSELTGVFRKHERGFGFVIPDELNAHGDLFIPPGNTEDAMTGDRVRCKVRREKRRGGGPRSPYVGRIVEVIQRSDRRYVGTLEKQGKKHFVNVDGKALPDAVLIRDPRAKNAKPGDKVVIDLVEYPGDGQQAEGVILEVLGDAGEPDVETQAVMRAFGLAEKFDADVIESARSASRRLDPDDPAADEREDLRDLLITTIDPPDAKDYDDAISVRRLDAKRESDGAAWELGVHIADVAHFVDAGSPLDQEAYERGNSTYLPRKVVPMLPELLSNGVCSLQEGVDRLTKTAFIRYDAKGKVVGERFCRSIIKSAKRMTYLEAQAVIDDDLKAARKHAFGEATYPREVIAQLKHMNELAKTIRKRRLDGGMIVLGLPEVELIFDDAGRVVDAEPEDDAFTHTIIEMFMVEANEAAARLFSRLDVPMVRRVHPDPDAHDVSELRQFARVAGYNIPMRPSRRELQQLLDSVRGKPAQHAVHIAVLRTLSKAEYAPQPIGHFALASEDYTHFTSPIRRYPDFIVHRSIDAYLDAAAALGVDGVPGKKQRRKLAEALIHDDRVPDLDKLVQFGKHCSHTERNSEEAERELRKYLVLELMASKLGEDFAGTVSGVIGRGVFVQIDRYLVDGFVPVAELPGSRDERYKLNHTTGALVAQRSGKTIQIGDTFTVRIAKVDLPSRQMELVVVEQTSTGGGASKGKPKGKGRGNDKSNAEKKEGGDAQDPGGRGKKGGGKPKKKTPRRQPRGAKQAHQDTMKVKKKRGNSGGGRGRGKGRGKGGGRGQGGGRDQ